MELCDPPNTSLNSVATGAYSLGCDTNPLCVFIRAILDMLVVIADDCSINMQNVKQKNSIVIIDRMKIIVVLALQPSGIVVVVGE